MAEQRPPDAPGAGGGDAALVSAGSTGAGDPSLASTSSTGERDPELASTSSPGGEVPLPPLVLRDGLPPLTDTPAGLAAAVAAIAAGSGPIALDTERASGYRYGQRAYLIQLRRAGASSFLIDPIALPGVPGLAQVLTGPEWILHAASQDLPCLAELDLHPSRLFDTELAGRLLGMERVGLSPMVAELLGLSLAKGYGAADWSTRPLPTDWLEYAALDVEVLIELREILTERLAQAGKSRWALEEFEAVRTAPPPEPRAEPWRRTSGMHRVRSRRALAVVAQLWHTRDRLARAADLAPGRLLPDSSIVAAAVSGVRTGQELRRVKEFHGRGAARHREDWDAALRQAWALADDQLPESSPRGDGPPPPRAWAQRDRAAAARLERARAELAALAAGSSLPLENLLTPELVRRLMWSPPAGTLASPAPNLVAAYLADRGARPWQVGLTAEPLAQAIPAPAATPQA